MAEPGGRHFRHGRYRRSCSKQWGTFFVGGTIYGNFPGVTQYGTHGNPDAFLVTFSSGGVFQLASQLGKTTFLTQSAGLALGPNGSIYLTGQTQAYLGGIQFGTQGNQDLFLAAFDTSDTLQWVNQLGQSLSYTYGTGLFIDNSGNVMASGATSGVVGLVYGSRNPSDNDALIAKFNPGGVLQWATQLGQAGQTTVGYSVAQRLTGIYSLAGYTTGVLTSPQLGAHGTQDGFVLTLDQNGVLQ